jgi:hypothetical protein
LQQSQKKLAYDAERKQMFDEQMEDVVKNPELKKL